MASNFVVITPAKNEEKFIEATINSVSNQSIVPDEWIIVNDGSTDNMVLIIQKYQRKFPWIHLINKTPSSSPFGSNVIEAFNIGLASLKTTNYKFIMKLDADIRFDSSRYFEELIHKFDENSKLGLACGYLYRKIENRKVFYKRESWHTTGAIKFYRKECFEDIGGLIPFYGWDGLDEYKAMYNGWITRSFKDLSVEHLGVEKESNRKKSKDYYIKGGVSQYKRGYGVFFILLKSFTIFISKRNIHYGLAFFMGYIMAWRSNEEKIVSTKEQNFIRRFQLKRLKEYISNGFRR